MNILEMDSSLIDSMDRFAGTLFKTSSNGANNLTESYGYDEDGIINAFVKDSTSITMTNSDSQWIVGSSTYDFDNAGRIKFKDDLSFDYGPNRRIQNIFKNGQKVATYFYDEERNPIYKEYTDGSFEFFYDDGVFSDGSFYWPVKLPGMEIMLWDILKTTLLEKLKWIT